MKKLLIMLLIMIIGISFIWAGGSQEEATATGGELKLFLPQSPGLVDGFQAIADAYQVENPDVTVTIRSVPFAKYKEQLQVMWASNDVDDIITTGSTDIRNYAYYGGLAPIDDILSDSEKGQFLASTIEAVSYNGSVYAYPFREACSAMYYNKTYFDMAGITAPDIEHPWTWSEWLTNVQKVKDVVKEQAGKDVWGLVFLSNPGTGDFWITPMIRSAGEKGSNTYKAISEDGLTVHGYGDTPEAMEAYHFFQDLYTRYELAPSAEVPDAFGTGQAITMISFMSSASTFNNKFPETEWGLMPIPFFKTPIVHTGGFTMGISAKSKNQTLAKDFIKFAGSDDGIKLYFDAIGGSDIVSRTDFADKYPEYYQEDYQKFFVEVMNAYGEARPLTPGYVLYNQIMGFNLYPDLALGADVESTVKQKIDQLESQLAQFK